MRIPSLPASDVTIHTDPSVLPEEPNEVEDRFPLLPERVQRALRSGLLIAEAGYHVFVATPPELSIEEDLAIAASRIAATKPVPPDLVYVFDFEREAEPEPLLLPAGRGVELSEAMAATVRTIRKRFAGLGREDTVRTAERALAKELGLKNRDAIAALEVRAKELGFGVRAAQGGVQTFPILHGKPVSQEQFGVLDDATKKDLERAEDDLSHVVERAAERIRSLTEEVEVARTEAVQHAAERIVGEEIAHLATKFADLPMVLGFIERAALDLGRRARELSPPENPTPEVLEQAESDAETLIRRYAVHVVVGHDREEPGAPVLLDRDPTPPRLFGFVERRAEYGLLVTDFTRIRAGSLISASGGYLILRAMDVLHDPFIWERLKRALRDRTLAFDDFSGPLGALATDLHPQPAPFTTRVLFVGSEHVYAALIESDPDFAALFRIKVEVEPEQPRTPNTLVALDGYMMTLGKVRGWLPFDRAARARLLDLSTRASGDRDHLSILLPPLEETCVFASAEARARNSEIVSRADVDIAWEDRRDRTSAAARSVRDQVLRGELFIETTGRRTGVVNGLAVVAVNDVHFGQPMRITAVVSLGNEGLIDVERESHLGGSVHTKGVAILRGILSLLFGQERPLSLRAQITFEQSYGEIDGDSASSSELFAILSAIADVGIDQGIAVTGSVNQLGEMQPIGGVAAKIEAFYDLCMARGLTGEQGVMMPVSNRRHLVLRDDVVEAIAKGTFQLWGVKDVWEGVEVLTGVAAGVRDEAGRFPAASVFGRVERRLIELAERLRNADGRAGQAMMGEGGGGDGELPGVPDLMGR